MKVTLRQSYSWNSVQLEPTEQTYAPEFVIDMKTEEVMEILKIQVQMEALQQRLKPLYEEAAELRKMNDERKKQEEEEAKATPEEQDEFINKSSLEV